MSVVTNATVANIETQELLMECATRKIIELKPEWVDVCAIGLRLYLTMCDTIGGPVPEVRFVHNARPCRLQFKLKDATDDAEFVANDVDIEKQKAIADAIFDAADKLEQGFANFDLIICAARLFMIGYDGLDGTLDKICIRADKKNYTMNLVKES